MKIVRYTKKEERKLPTMVLLRSAPKKIKKYFVRQHLYILCAENVKNKDDIDYQSEVKYSGFTLVKRKKGTYVCWEWDNENL